VSPTRWNAQTPRTAICRLVDRAQDMPGWSLGLAIFVPLLAIYIATGNTNVTLQSPDPVAAALPAWHWAAFHSLYLDHVKIQNLWVGTFRHHLVSNRQPGVIAFGIPFYLLLDRGPQFSMFPAVVAGASASAGAVAVLTVTLRREFGAQLALITGFIVAFGTATWSVSSDTLWTHGPNELLLATAMYFLSRHKLLPASIAIALCVPIRAHLAVFAAVAGIWFAVKHRSVKPLAVFALPSMLALEALSLYNHWIFGSWSLDGGYPPYATENITSTRFGTVPLNILGSFVSLDRGIIIWCPLAIVLCVSLRTAWRQAPEWVRISAVGGLGYFLIQMKLNFFSGGDRFWSYRLVIESLLLVTPLLSYAARDVISRRPVVTRLATAAAVYCVGTQAVGAIYYKPNFATHSAWSHSKLAQELVSGGNGPRVVMAVTTVLSLVALFRPRRAESSEDPVVHPELAAPAPAMAK
jgi:hypothetical protein